MLVDRAIRSILQQKAKSKIQRIKTIKANLTMKEN